MLVCASSRNCSLTIINTLFRRARAAAGEVVASLLGAVSPAALERLAGFALEWLSGRDGRLRRAACQVGPGGLLGSAVMLLRILGLRHSPGCGGRRRLIQTGCHPAGISRQRSALPGSHCHCAHNILTAVLKLRSGLKLRPVETEAD
jgi:hypothetical protein